MPSIHVRVTEETDRDLKALSDKTGHPKSAIVRIAVLRYIAAEKKK